MKHSLFTLGIVAASLSVATLSCTTQQQPTEVTWGTFNIRYDNPGDSLNNWQYRKDNVAQFIKSQDIDIVGMQEVLHNQLEDLKSRLPEYAEVGVGREDGKQRENTHLYSTKKTASKYSTVTHSGSHNIRTV